MALDAMKKSIPFLVGLLALTVLLMAATSMKFVGNFYGNGLFVTNIGQSNLIVTGDGGVGPGSSLIIGRGIGDWRATLLADEENVIANGYVTIASMYLADNSDSDNLAVSMSDGCVLGGNLASSKDCTVTGGGGHHFGLSFQYANAVGFDGSSGATFVFADHATNCTFNTYGSMAILNAATKSNSTVTLTRSLLIGAITNSLTLNLSDTVAVIGPDSNLVGFNTNGFIMVDRSTFPTSSIPVGSASRTNAFSFIYKGIPRIVATNRAVGGYMRWRTTDETWQAFTP